MGPLAFYVGLKVTRVREKRTIKFSQPRYIKKLLDCHGILKAKTNQVLMQETTLITLIYLHQTWKKLSILKKLVLLYMSCLKLELILLLLLLWSAGCQKSKLGVFQCYRSDLALPSWKL